MIAGDICQVQSIDLSELGLQRDHMIPKQFRDRDVEAEYDRSTLSYDAVWSDGKVVMVCPPLLNLKSTISGIRLDNVRVRRWQHRKYKYFDVITVRAAVKPASVSVEIGDNVLSSGVSATDHLQFENKNVLLVKSRNNELAWVADFVKFHRVNQNAEAILFFDNGSDAYTLDALRETILDAGLSCMIVDAPFRFGPDVRKAGAKFRNRTQFFQHAMLNLAKLRFLKTARAVLSIDIDELVWSEGGSVFDKAVQSRFGYVSFRGFWRNPDPDTPAPLRHADHVWGNVRHSRTGKLPSAHKKYAVVPDSLLGRMIWSVHRVGVPPFERIFERRDCGYWHCAAISTGWRYKDRLKQSGGRFIDEDMKIACQRAGLKRGAPC